LPIFTARQGGANEIGADPEGLLREVVMDLFPTTIPEIKLLRLRRFDDERGFFSETYSHRTLAASGILDDFVQDNHSLSRHAGVIRGLHFQIPPFAQAKLLRVVRGSVLDVAVDIRVGSPTFARHVAAVLSADRWNQIYIPVGIAHGFATLEPGTEVIYKVSDYYAPEFERGVLWNDPALAIDWPVPAGATILSDKDRRHPPLAALPSYFFYQSDASAGLREAAREGANYGATAL
jgi:dTDP-4-dehydrorhamnose 3,5-epimerase